MNSFLPTMPFKQSNFARTHKAIKLLRQGPLNDSRRRDNLSGQFINLNDYAAMHGQFAPGDSRMYLRPAEDFTSGLQSTEAGGVTDSKDYKMFHMSQSGNNDDAINHIT